MGIGMSGRVVFVAVWTRAGLEMSSAAACGGPRRSRFLEDASLRQCLTTNLSFL